MADEPTARPWRRQHIEVQPELANQLHDASLEVERGRDHVRRLERERAALIGRALSAGWSYGQIAAVTGMDRESILAAVGRRRPFKPFGMQDMPYVDRVPPGRRR